MGLPTISENLIAAKALIDAPEKWGKGAGVVPPYGCHCAITALGTDHDDIFFSTVEMLTNQLQGKWRGLNVFDFNDHPDTTHADVMALFDRAIAKAGA